EGPPQEDGEQCQRMEAQRSDPPLPPGGQELLELLLRVQGGGRMEEQRSRPPTHTC
uniref:G protein signaling modulator 3 n=1 Tax=Chinchilla lanigera TaxID=34839 RepID=A0A8C2V6H4_CHILA